MVFYTPPFDRTRYAPPPIQLFGFAPGTKLRIRPVSDFPLLRARRAKSNKGAFVVSGFVSSLVTPPPRTRRSLRGKRTLRGHVGAVRDWDGPRRAGEKGRSDPRHGQICAGCSILTISSPLHQVSIRVTTGCIDAFVFRSWTVRARASKAFLFLFRCLRVKTSTKKPLGPRGCAAGNQSN